MNSGQAQPKSHMEKKKTLLVAILLIVAYLTSVGVVGFGYFMPDNLDDLAPGMPSPVTFAAPRQIVNSYELEAAQEAAAAAVEPHTVIDADISEQIMHALEDFFAHVGELRAEFAPLLLPFQGLTPTEERELPDYSDLIVVLSEEQARHIISGGSAAFARFVAATTEYFSAVVDEGISIVTMAHSHVMGGLRQQDFDETYLSIGQALADELLLVNRVIDEETTENLRLEARNNVVPTYFFVRQNIVVAGEIVTPAAYRALVELGYLGGEGAIMLVGVAGSALVVTIVFCVAMLYLFLNHRDIVRNRRRALMLFSLFMVTIVLARVMVPLNYYLTPIMLFAMLVSVLIDQRLSMVLTAGIALIVFAMNPSDTMFLSYALVNGFFAAMIAKYVVGRGWPILPMLLLAAVNASTVAANYFLFSATFSTDVFNSAIFAVGGGFVTIVLTIGTLPLWESLFEVVTQNNLLELTNPNNALLRRMAIETPGTYYHSIVVANLAETASYEVGANHIMARVGAYYHDIGKMKYPQYFAENQSGVNPHDALPPRTSVEVISDHITRGMEFAKQYKLPIPIRAFIFEHHGTSMMKAFYHKEKTRKPDAQICDADFRYKNTVPQSRESAVVMLADTCEAAVRSVVASKGKDMTVIEELVRTLIKDKLDDGQLDESELSIKDLNVIAKAFMRVFNGMYHERVPYPSTTMKELIEQPEAEDAEDADGEDKEGEAITDDELGDTVTE